MEPLKVFLSYSHTDKIVARRVVRRLMAHGIKVWFDDRELRIGAALPSTIRTHIENAHTLLVIASHNSADSHWVGMELNFAKEHGKPIVPIFIEPLSTHQCFRDYLGLDACSFQSFAEVIDELMRELYASVDLELPPPDRDILILHLRELAKEEPNLAPLIFGYLDGEGLHIENADTVFGVTFHTLDDALSSLFILYPRADMATCAAYGFSIAGAGTRALSSWIGITGDGGSQLITALSNQTLAYELIPTAIELLSTCNPPNNHALFKFIEKNIGVFDESQRRSVIRLVTYPVRAGSSLFEVDLAFVALKHFPISFEIQQMWKRWINNGIFDGKPHNPNQLAYYLSRAHEQQLQGWEPVNEALRYRVRTYLRSRDKEKVNIAIDHVIAAADKAAPVLVVLLRETNGVSGTAEWDDWRKRDPGTAELMGWYVHFISEEALRDRNWLRAWKNAKEMVEFDEMRKQIRQNKNNGG